MTRMTWDAQGQRFFEAGVDRGVLYVGSQAGVPWSGLISVSESVSGGESTGYYIDGVKYLNVVASSEFEASVNAFTYPDEFDICQGIQSGANGLMYTHQRSTSFGLSYRTLVGNDVEGTDFGYKIHLVYQALVAPPSRDRQTISDNATPSAFTWSITATPPEMVGRKPTAHLYINSADTDPDVLTNLENILYGSPTTEPRLPLPSELATIFAA